MFNTAYIFVRAVTVLEKLEKFSLGAGRDQNVQNLGLATNSTIQNLFPNDTRITYRIKSILWCKLVDNITRMHSSRMRIGRS